MSDFSQGPGWWQASDGKWYPPQPTTPPGMLPTPPPSSTPDASSFVRSLYDFQFDHFVTPKLIRFFYGFFVIVLTIGAVLFLFASLASGSEGIIFGLIVIPIGYFLYLIFGRMYFELVAALFRIADDLRAIRNNTDR